MESLALRDRLLLVTTGVWGLRLIDVSDAGAPKLLGELRTTCYPMEVAASADYAYLADGYCGSDGLFMVDIRTPAKPRGTQTFAGRFANVRVRGHRLFSLGPEKTLGFDLAK